MISVRLLIICIGLFTSVFVKAQFGVRGSAELFDTDCFHLSADSLQSSGKIISNRVIDLTEPFTLYTELFFGSNNDGGDGIAFFFQSNNQESTELSPSFGLGRNPPSIAVEFDTYKNDGFSGVLSDPDFDHIALMLNGDFNHSSGNNLQGPISANVSGNVEDGNWHNVKIDWQPLTNTITVFFNCEEKINYQIDLINEVFGGNPEVFYGFSASTFHGQNQQQICVVINTLTDRLQDVILCQGGKTQINAVRGGERYDWTPAEGLNNAMSANPVGTPSSDTDYALVIQTGYCDDVLNYEINIEVHDTIGPRDFISEDTTLCADQIFTMDATLEDATSYAWSTGLPEPIESFTRNGRYDVTVTLHGVCIVEDWARLTFEEERPDVDLGNDTTICIRSNGFMLKPIMDVKDAQFSWNDGSAADSIFVNREGLYTLTVSNKCGSAIDDILVTSEDCRNFYMPNAFSPNSDGINDMIYPFTEAEDVSKISSYKIYNRWGVEVFYLENGIPNGPELGWDGTYRNKPAAPGVYIYEIILQFRDGQESLIKGDFTLFK